MNYPVSKQAYPLKSFSSFVCLPVFACLCGLLVGCGTTFTKNSLNGGATAQGRLFGGQQPISGATIQLYAVGTGGDGSAASALVLSTVTTSDGSGLPDSNANAGNLANTLPVGDFTLNGLFLCPITDPLVYMVATGGNPGLDASADNTAVAEMAALGRCSTLQATTFVNITEVTTVGAVAALYPYMSSYSAVGSGSSDAAALTTAFSTAAEYANVSIGTAPGTVPAGYYASTAAVNTLADIMAACINTPGGSYNDGSVCGSFFYDAEPASGTAATDTIGALLQILENPSNNVTALFGLQSSTAPFFPVLANPPSTWALPIVAIPFPPSISPSNGTFSAAEMVTLSDADMAAAIYYTLDGSAPSPASTLYQGAFSLGMTTTIKAIAVDSGAVSATASASLTFTGDFPNVSLLPTTVPQYSTVPATVIATSTANGSTATFSESGVGGAFSPVSCVIVNGVCSVSYVPSGELATGTYPGALIVSFSPQGAYSATSISSSLKVDTGVTSVAESVLISFTGMGGSYPGQSPVGQLVLASDGNFYGTTEYGGTNNLGVVYRLTPSGAYTVLHAFAGGGDGAEPLAGLVQGSDGNLYGTTFFFGGDSNAEGTVFQITPAGVLTTLHTFEGGSSDGANPQAPLMQAMAGKVYNGSAFVSLPDGYLIGQTNSGGSSNSGTFFSISMTGDYSSFYNAGGGAVSNEVEAGFLQLSGGGVQNIAYGGVGITSCLLNIDYSIDTGNCSQDGGFNALGGLIEAPANYLYATTEFGGTSISSGKCGTNGCGTLFQDKYKGTGPTSDFYSFTGGNDGALPLAPLLMASDGNLYGTASQGGQYGGVGLVGPAGGTAYSITTAGHFTALYQFGGTSTDAATPEAALLQSADGNFYSASAAGGASGNGAIYKLVPNVTLQGPVSLTAPATVAPGAAFTLGYSVVNAYSDTVKRCFATNTAGDTTVWTGVQTGSPTVTNMTLTAPSAPGTYTYALTCGGTESGFATVTVQ